MSGGCHIATESQKTPIRESLPNTPSHSAAQTATTFAPLTKWDTKSFHDFITLFGTKSHRISKQVRRLHMIEIKTWIDKSRRDTFAIDLRHALATRC